jgi:hypothetical protein
VKPILYLLYKKKIFVIAAYDISPKRISKAMKICRKYLLHLQKSVFKGILMLKNKNEPEAVRKMMWLLRALHYGADGEGNRVHDGKEEKTNRYSHVLMGILVKKFSQIKIFAYISTAENKTEFEHTMRSCVYINQQNAQLYAKTTLKFG